MLNKFKELFYDEQGQGAAEYGLILALVVAAVIAAMTIFKTQLSTMFTSIGDKLQAALNSK
ncbi:MAG: Flp family type IVb pilin [Clostridiaceae bacterium]